MTAKDEKRLILLAAIIGIGGNGSKKKVLDEIESTNLMKLSSYDLLSRASRSELNWRNDLAYVRSHLVKEGHMSSTQWNRWVITEKGKEYFESLAQRLLSQHVFQHINPENISTIKALTSDQQPSDDNALSGETALIEGQKTQRWTNTYERNPQLRASAIRAHGVKCMACGFNFAATYGDIGSGFIEVHHTKPISSLGGTASVNPITDLVVLCSNCHSIVHRKRPTPMSLDDLRELIKN